MLFAETADGARVEPTRGARARCGQCGSEVVAKCGQLVVWHWAHRATDCDTWSEGESEWHLSWKRQVEPSACEVVIGEHRADIQTAEGVVVELQHSPLPTSTIEERERFYGEMVWLFDARQFELMLHATSARLSFVWQHPRRSLLRVTKPMYWDIGAGFALRVESLSPESPLGGFSGRGVLLDAACLASQLFGRAARPNVHASAAQRAQRVAACLQKARSLLGARPSLGLDEATRAAMNDSPLAEGPLRSDR